MIIMLESVTSVCVLSKLPFPVGVAHLSGQRLQYDG